ncbi:MAG: septal ring lytic transglycosylase RlpA family protein [Polyangia bacterium]
MKRLLLLAVLLSGCAHASRSIDRRSKIVELPSGGFRQEGLASWYGREQQGGPTASGERFDMRLLTAAHRKLPMQTHVRVTSKLDGRSVDVRINDRGPFSGKRIIDLSWAAAKVLGMLDRGVIPVVIQVIQ